MIRTQAVAIALSIVGLAAEFCRAQAPLAVGHHDTSFLQGSGFGTTYVQTHLVYPSVVGGLNAPVAPNPNGWPVIVWLHGFGLWGQHYQNLGEAWARAGFLVVQLDTGIWDHQALTFDGQSVFHGLVAANLQDDHILAGAIDPQRIALAGHSMGGGCIANVLAANPGYRCAFAFAPVDPGAASAAQVTIPFGIAVGGGDPVTPWWVHSLPYYTEARPQHGLKTCYVMNAGCDHMNLVGLSGSNDPYFRRALSVSTGFLRHYLGIDSKGLEKCIGPTALAAPECWTSLKQAVQPQIWAAAPLRLGTTVRVSVALEQGPSGILAANSISPGITTSLGTLLLDPATMFMWTAENVDRIGRVDAYLTTPNHPILLGFTVAMQAVGTTPAITLELGTATQLVVGN